MKGKQICARFFLTIIITERNCLIGKSFSDGKCFIFRLIDFPKSDHFFRKKAQIFGKWGFLWENCPKIVGKSDTLMGKWGHFLGKKSSATRIHAWDALFTCYNAIITSSFDDVQVPTPSKMLKNRNLFSKHTINRLYRPYSIV